jgi:putative ABC transport system permease protein
MFKNYLKVFHRQIFGNKVCFLSALCLAWLHLINNRVYSLINIVGLAVGLAAFLLIFLYVQREYSYDRHWPQAERLHRLNTTLSMPGNQDVRFAAAPLLAAGAMEDYFSAEIAFSTRMIRNLRQLADELLDLIAARISPV